MGRAIRCTCSHCQRDVYFDPTAASLDSLSTLPCRECGKRGMVITLNADQPPDAELLGSQDSPPTTEQPSRADVDQLARD